MNYSLKFKKGWNLISFFTTNVDLINLKNNKELLEIKSSDGKVYNSKLDDYFNTLKKINIGEAYWINTSSEFEIKFVPPFFNDEQEFNLNKGWNLIGYPYILDTKLNNIPPEIIEIRTEGKSFNSKIDNDMNTLKKLEKNKGIWVKSNSKITWKIFYPSKNFTLLESKEIFGILLTKNTTRSSLNLLNKLNYVIDSSYYTVSYNGFNEKFTNLENEIDDLLDFLFKKKFNIYLDSNNKVEGVDFIDGLKVFSFFNGEVSLFNGENRFIEFRFNGLESERFFIDIPRNQLIFNCDGFNIFLSLKYVQYTDYELSIDKDEFLCDYNLNSINIRNLILHEDGIPINIINFEKADNFGNSSKLILKVNAPDFGSNIILDIEKSDNINKSLQIKLIVDDIVISEGTLIIIQNLSFKLENSISFYNILLEWEGEIEENIIPLSRYSDNTNYLYWFDFNSIEIQEFYVSNLNYSFANKLEFNEVSEDYMVFSLNIFFDNLRFVIIKDSRNNGLISVYCKSLFNNDLVKVPIYQDKFFQINSNLKIKMKWTGKFDKFGYNLKNTLSYEQRDLGLKLNTYETFKFDNFTVKVHYMIGNNNDSINLEIWKSYKNFLDTLYEIIKFTVNIAKEFNLKFPQKEFQIIKNGGSSDYDVYVLNLGSSSIKGYTAGDDFARHTENERDVITYMTLSNDLDLIWLKTVFYHEFFHSIQGSYDWFDLKWISEGLAVAFEYNLANFSYLSPKYFLSDIISSRNLSLSYEDNFRFYNNQLEILFKEEINNDGYFSISLENIYTKNGRVNLSTVDLEKINIVSSNQNFSLVKKKIIVINGSSILKLYFKFFDYQKTFLYIFIDGTIITSTNYAHSGRYYGTFIFFQYLFEKYYMKTVISTLMDQTLKYDGFKLIEESIFRLNPSSSFIQELINFWIAVELMSNSEQINEKFRFLNADLWKNYINDKFYYDLEVSESSTNTIIIDDLEATGCSVVNINFNNIESFKLNMNKNNLSKNLYYTFIINYGDNKIDVKSSNILIGPLKINLNSNVNSIKMLIVADKNFPSNNEIPISSSKNLDRDTIFDFYIRVNKK